jgi:F-type H+-transporting ATPase subunit gamma
MDWNALFSELIQEYLYVSVFRAFAASLSAENASRLSSMEAAEQNIEDRLDNLEHRFHQVRQHSITSELLDIVSGAEAATG